MDKKEYIEREAAIKELCQVFAPTPSESYIVEKCIDKIDNMSAADVVKHGKWIWKELYGEVGYMLVCSECEESEGACERFDYCPNCGAKMDLD